MSQVIGILILTVVAPLTAMPLLFVKEKASIAWLSLMLCVIGINLANLETTARVLILCPTGILAGYFHLWEAFHSNRNKYYRTPILVVGYMLLLIGIGALFLYAINRL